MARSSCVGLVVEVSERHAGPAGEDVDELEAVKGDRGDAGGGGVGVVGEVVAAHGELLAGGGGPCGSPGVADELEVAGEGDVGGPGVGVVGERIGGEDLVGEGSEGGGDESLIVGVAERRDGVGGLGGVAAEDDRDLVVGAGLHGGEAGGWDDVAVDVRAPALSEGGDVGVAVGGQVDELGWPGGRAGRRARRCRSRCWRATRRRCPCGAGRGCARCRRRSGRWRARTGRRRGASRRGCRC
jgi:hypothetical protein